MSDFSVAGGIAESPYSKAKPERGTYIVPKHLQVAPCVLLAVPCSAPEGF
jgi:hypothetical protein